MLVGNIGKIVFHEPKTELSKGVTKFSIAVDKNDDTTLWINVKLFKKINEAMSVGYF